MNNYFSPPFTNITVQNLPSSVQKTNNNDAQHKKTTVDRKWKEQSQEKSLDLSLAVSVHNHASHLTFDSSDASSELSIKQGLTDDTPKNYQSVYPTSLIKKKRKRNRIPWIRIRWNLSDTKCQPPSLNCNSQHQEELRHVYYAPTLLSSERNPVILFWVLVVIQQLSRGIFRFMHDLMVEGLYAVWKTLEKLKNHHWKTKRFSDMRQYVSCCSVCQVY